LATSLLLASGCKAPSLPTPAREQAVAQQHAAADSAREQLQMIPPPSKNRYMVIHSFESWENPYITVQSNMLELHVLQADANPSDVGAGGLLRPVGARRQELNISPDKLADAITAVPQSAWPYGRVIAIEEAHKIPKAAEPAVRRQMEIAIGKLNDLGVVVYDPTEGSLR
jgi:hypothetical protein